MKTLFKLLPFLLLTACVNDTTSDKKKQVVNSNSKIKNNIILEEHGLSVEQAYLMFEDNTFVPESNETTINKKIKCHLIISNGWEEKDGKVFPGASESIETNTGKMVLNEKDLFKQYEAEGVSLKDAQYITLSASISSIDKLYDYFLVKFKVWDKTGQGYVEGSFKFVVK